MKVQLEKALNYNSTNQSFTSHLFYGIHLLTRTSTGVERARMPTSRIHATAVLAGTFLSGKLIPCHVRNLLAANLSIQFK